MGLDDRHRHIPVAEQLLDGPDVVAIFQEAGSKGVPIMQLKGFGIPAFCAGCLAALCERLGANRDVWR